MSRLLVVMGSGETAPTMVKIHRRVLERAGPGPAVVLDTPYGFQENADDISARAAEYFARSVGRPVEVASLRRAGGDDPVRREAALATIAAASWVFAGPGSPSYALRQWRGTEVPYLLADKLSRGGCLVLASAAALTLGRYAVPVYEIYKVGAEPAWAEGLDLTAPFLGPHVAVIPHYDNAEGGTHDTRFCYLGEKRLRLLEAELPEEGWVLGVDEHTACILDLDAGTATVEGSAGVTVRSHGTSSVLPAGRTVPISTLRDMASGKGPAAATPCPPSGPAAGAPGPGARPAGASPLHAETNRLSAAFSEAVGRGEVDTAVGAALELDDALRAWSADTTQSDANERGRAALRRMVVRLGELARDGARDPREVLGGYLDILLHERSLARAAGRWEDADRVRSRLADLGVEVRDTPGGAEWHMRPR